MQPTDTTVNLDISADSAKVTEKIQDFIKKFNDIYVYLKEKTRSTKEGRGLLIGDSTAENFKYMFSSMATSAVPGINADEVNSLSKLGLSFHVTEGLSVGDTSKLEKLIKEKPEQVETLFNSTNGIATKLHEKILPYVNATGFLYKRKTSFGIESEYLDDRITAVKDKVELNASNLRLRYMKSMSQTNALVSNQSIFFMKSINY
jgi:flagellar hook-associated protein 2